MSNALKLLIILLSSCVLAGCVTTADMKNSWLFICPDGYQFTAEYSRDFEYVNAIPTVALFSGLKVPWRFWMLIKIMCIATAVATLPKIRIGSLQRMI